MREVHLQALVHHETGSTVVHVLPLQSLVVQVQVCLLGRSLSDFGVVCGDVVRESAELFHVYRFSSYQVFSNVGYKRFPDNQHLTLGLKGFLRAGSPLRSVVVLSWVRRSVLQKPEKERVTRNEVTIPQSVQSP